MARRIEFLAPVEAMRGNLSGKQVLKYPTKNNTAWDAPSDKRSYATNYSTRYVGAKRSRDGKKYFTVKQRAAVTNTPAQREAQALLAGSKIIADSMLKDITIIASLLRMYQGYAKSGLNYHPEWIPSDIESGNPVVSLRRYLMRNIRELTLIPKNKQFVVQPQSGPNIVYNNPWRFGNNTGTKVTVITDQFVKFWKQLTSAEIDGAPIYFYVNGLTALSYTDWDFSQVVGSAGDTENQKINVLNLTTQTIGSTGYVKYGSNFLILNGEYVTDAESPIADANYHTTDIAPTA